MSRLRADWASQLAAWAAAGLAALVISGCGDGGDPGTESAGSPEAQPITLGYSEVFQPGELDPDLVGRSGAQIARRPLNWTSIEPRPGEFDWTLYDDVNADFEVAGLKPLWVVTSAPCWAAAADDCEDNSPSYAPARRNLTDYASFAAAVAERYPNSAGIEIWNEPNLERFFIGSSGPAFYARMLGKATRAIKATGTEMPVIFAGLSPVPKDGRGRKEWTGYLAKALEAGGDEEFDALGLHPYSAFEPGEGVAPAAERMISQAEDALERADLDKPIWITEVGVSTAGGEAVSPEVQASELAEVYAIALAQSIPVLILHRLYDQAEAEFPIEAGYGVIEADMETAKPALCELGMLVGVEC